MRKILFLITTLCNGGAERVLVDTVNAMDKEKFDVTVQTIVDIGALKGTLASHIHYKTMINIPFTRLRGWVTKFIREFLPAKMVYKLFVRERYDVEIAFLEGFPTKIIAASDHAGSSKIAWIHTDLMHYFGSSEDYASFEENKEAYERFDRIVGVSQDVVARFRQRFAWEKDNTIVLYNVNDDAGIRRKAQEKVALPESNGKLRFVACGRLCAQKGYDRLLRIHKRLLDEGFEHILWIVGEGEEREKLEHYIEENSLENTVGLLGFQQNPYPYIANADVFVCSSLAEGYSTVVTEAYMLGVPIITTRISGACEPVECPRYSVLCENDEESLYEAMKGVLQDPDVLFSFKKRMRGTEHYFSTKYQVGKIEAMLTNE